MTLSSVQLGTLRDLADDKAGVRVDWINVARARWLTTEGLASRTRQGWRITAAGEELLQSHLSEQANTVVFARFGAERNANA